ncbi:MAG: glutamyl-tRNA reductase [Steroidobacteraceae bacterium]|jgi:glutamyl-tRNA reductase|nr:glutamyl-tRNA reductase [Steroidobacteraceae bacterium]
MVPLALVGMSYREAPSAVRAALAAIDAEVGGPSQQLLDAGQVTGVVRIESCARVEWLFAAEHPAWAAELFSATLIGAAENPDRLRPRVRHGAAAAGALLRVAAGLDSVAQGEHAIGNQVLRSFERAHEAGTVCRNLHVAWRGVGEMLGKARRILPQGRTGGVQQLVIDRITDVPRDASIAVFGLGEIGRAMLRALNDAGFLAAESFNRASMRAFDGAVARAEVVIIASGAPHAWLTLPPGEGRQVFDLGSPLQIVAAPGWRMTGLDELLDGHGAVLPDAEYAALEAECATSAEKICQTLLAPPPSDTLAAMTAIRTEFMQNKLPGLLEGLPPQRARKLTSEVNAMLHEFISAARREPQ